MYRDTVTLFNRHHTREGDTWLPTVLQDVDLNIDKAAIAAKYGTSSQDKALLHVKYSGSRVCGKPWLSPKEWAAQEPEALASSLTFADGEDFDFFYAGEWQGAKPVLDDEYPDGFYDYMNQRYDFVFAVSSVAKYTVIPHFEITGK